jgi:hypothetical protein
MVDFPTFVSLPYADVDAYAEFMRPLITPWIKQAWIAIVNPLDRIVTEDPITGVVQSATVTPIYTGYSRIQPLRTALNQKRATDSTTTRTVQFWVEFPKDNVLPDIKPGFEIVVMDGKNDPSLTEYKYLVTGSQNSSMAWQRTIETTVNLESRPDYDTSGWPQPPVT